MIERLFEAGVDVFRINMSHSSFDLVKKVHSALRNAEARFGRPIGILCDLQGPSSASATSAVSAYRWPKARPSASIGRRATAGPSAFSCRIRRSSRRWSPGIRCCSTTARSAWS
jgi:hypothetical protein